MVPNQSQAASLFLGELPPDQATVEQMVMDRMRYTGDPLFLLEEYKQALELLPQPKKLKHGRQRHDLDDWHKPDEFDTLFSDNDEDENSYTQHPAMAGLLKASTKEKLTPDYAGWLRYLGTQGPIDHALKHPRYQRKGLFSEHGLTESVLVVAQRGWGKSTLLKALIRHQTEMPRNANPAGAVVLLDPGGDLALQVARWPELSGPDRGDRLVYVEPRLQRGLTVGFNPLDGTGLDEESRSDVAGFLVEAIGNLIADLTLAMRNLIRGCCRVLLWTPGATLRDLHIMLGSPEEDRRAARLYERACTYPDEDVRKFFRHRFTSDEYRSTKGFLRNRIEEVLLIHDLGGMFAGTATVDLRAAVESRKVVLVNLAKFENEEEQRTAGRLLATMVIAIARRRAQTPDAPRPPIHLVIDEATVVAGNELVRALAQCRKYGLNLILAQQVMASGFSPADKETLVKNTGCRFVGGRDRKTIADVLSNGKDFADDLPKIEPRQFWAEWTGDGPHLLNVRSDLADRGPGINDAAWTAYVAAVTDPERGYYRPTKPDRVTLPDLPKLPINHDTMEILDHGSMENGSVPAADDDETPAPPPLKSSRFGLRKPKPAGTVVPPAPAPRSRAASKGVELIAEPKTKPKMTEETPVNTGEKANLKKPRRKKE